MPPRDIEVPELIAYAVDGVLVGRVAPNESYLEQWALLRTPLFQPTKPYVILTARPSWAFDATMNLVDHMRLRPEQVYHGCTALELSIRYKASILNENPQITSFFESEIAVVEGVRKLLNGKCKVIHFGSWISENM